MKRNLLLLLAISIVCASAVVNAQPNITVYFDSNLSQTAAQCPPGTPGTVVDTVYVVLNNAASLLTGAEFMVDYSPAMTWLGDSPNTDVAVGSSNSGISLGFNAPQNTADPVLLLKATVLWMCNDCSQTDIQVTVMPHPDTPGATSPQIVTFPGFNTTDAVGMVSMICSTLPVNESTWGRVKALYQ